MGEEKLSQEAMLESEYRNVLRKQLSELVNNPELLQICEEIQDKETLDQINDLKNVLGQLI